jgi:hypothetical protein
MFMQICFLNKGSIGYIPSFLNYGNLINMNIDVFLSYNLIRTMLTVNFRLLSHEFTFNVGIDLLF